MNHVYDRDELMRLTREGMENSMKFFMSMNENIIKVSEQQREAINANTNKNLETINKACEDYQRNTRVILSRMETLWNQVIDQSFQKTKSAE